MRVLTLLLGAACAALAPRESGGADLGPYRWKQRVLVISAPATSNETYRTQAAELLAVWAGLVERDFVVLTEFGSEDFSIALVGKDGGEKLRRGDVLRADELFAVVDAMPMRRAEMRERARGAAR